MPGLSIPPLLLLAALAVTPAGAESALPLQVSETAGDVTVETADWKIVFGRAFNGGPYRWFDRRFDPAEQDNLATASGGGSYSQGALFDYDVYLGTHGGNAAEYMTTMGFNADPGALELEVLEATAVRARIRQRGHPRLNNGGGPPGDPFPELPLVLFTTEWTLYPTGKAYIDFSSEVSPAGQVVDAGPGGGGKAIATSGATVQAGGGASFLATGVWAGDTIESVAGGFGPVTIAARTGATTLQLAQAVPAGSALDYVVRRNAIVMETISIHADGDPTLVNQCSDPATSRWQGGSNGDPLWSVPDGSACQTRLRNQGFGFPPLGGDFVLAHWASDREAGSLLAFYEPWAGVNFGAFNDRGFTDISYTQLGRFGVRPVEAHHRHFLAQLGSGAPSSLPPIRSVADALPQAQDYRSPYAEALAGTLRSGADVDAHGFDLRTGAYGIAAEVCTPAASCRRAALRFDTAGGGRAGAVYVAPAIELDGFDHGLPAGDVDVRVDLSSDGGASFTALPASSFNLSAASDEAEVGAGRRVFQYLAPIVGGGSAGKVLRFTATSQCGAEPQSGCRAALRSRLAMRMGRVPSLAWTWHGGAETMASDFGDPQVATETSLCVYAGTPAQLIAEVSVAPAEACGSRPCWRAVAGRGHRYRRRGGNADGLSALRLLGASGGRSKIVARASGEALALPALPIDPGDGLVVQLANDASRCFEAAFAPAAIRRNTDRALRAVLP